MRKKVVFFGTPELAAEVLKTLHSSSAFEIALVVTNPDAPSGRGQRLQSSAVKLTAIELGLPVFTPEKLNTEAFSKLQSLAPEVFIVVAYGKIFPQRFLDLPRLGAFNLHFSLLPKYRGASPVQSAILAGEKESGFTIFKLVQRMDAGPRYVQEKIDIEQKTADQVFEEMTVKGGMALLQFSNDLCRGKEFTPIVQDESQATYCRKFTKADGQVFPERETVEHILCKHRAFSIWPQLFWINPQSGKRIKLLKLKEYIGNISNPKNERFVFAQQKCLLQVQDGFVEVEEAQLEGGKILLGSEFYTAQLSALGR